MHSRFIFSLLIVGIVFSCISESVALPNPAAIYCLDTGGTSISRTRSDGSLVGECMLSNGIICEEWAYYRGECSGGGNTGGACTTEYTPVCAVVPTSTSCESSRQLCPPDGRTAWTYSNSCQARLRGAVILFSGSCDAPSSCGNEYVPVCASLQRTCSSGFACPQYLSLETYANPCKAYTAGAVIVSTGACNTQGVCTQEARLCSDGSVMPRNMQTCAWLPHLCPNQPIVCTLEMRYCSDGSVMQRNTQTCEWLPSLCPDETDPYTYAYQHGITSMPTRFLFRPYDTITRQEATKMILAAIPLLNNGYELSSLNDCSRGFLDEDRFDRSLTPTVYRMCELGLMFGDRGYFRPRLNMTRREMYIILTRLMEKAGYLDQMKVIPTENLKSPITREEVVRWIQILAISKGSIYY